MSEQKCPGLMEAAHETFVLAVELGEGTVDRSPATIRKLLKSPKVWEELKKVLEAKGKQLSKSGQTRATLSEDDAKKLNKQLLTTARTVTEAELKRIVQKSPEYQRFQHGLKQLECSFKKSPIGVWVDENQTWLLIVGVALAVGGGVVMYQLQGGDMVGKPLADLADNRSVDWKIAGSLKLQAGTKNVTFVPSQRKVDATTFAKLSLKKVDVTFTERLLLKNGKLQSTTTGEVVVPVATSVKLKGDAKVAGTKLSTAGVRAEGNWKFGENTSLKGHAQGGYAADAEKGTSGFVYDLHVRFEYATKTKKSAKLEGGETFEIDPNPGSTLHVSAYAMARQTLEAREIGGGAEFKYELWKDETWTKERRTERMKLSLTGKAEAARREEFGGNTSTNFNASIGLRLDHRLLE